MTKEDKKLLLKDLCARLPFMPKIKITYQQQGIRGTDEGRVSCDFIEKIVNDLRNGVITDIQIYLRPMSSMTEKEKDEFYNNGSGNVDNRTDGKGLFFRNNFVPFEDINYAIDWLNAHLFDYRGLIEKGLALESPVDMYKVD